MRVAAVILTFNEEQHLDRCIDSIEGVVDDVYVVDSFSTDGTSSVCARRGVFFLQNPWFNYATQFNWALSMLPGNVDWVLRIDADEYISPELAVEINAKLPHLGPEVKGAVVGRRMTFLGNPVNFGGVFPVRVLRLFRLGEGQCENRWMDEHIKVDGCVVEFDGEMVDDNKKGLTWWVDKHNSYASREAVDLLNLDFGFMPHDTVASVRRGGQAGLKRWLKEYGYARLPLGWRAFAYFFYRYIIRLGFLDGDGASFHVLQGLWYRYLVDAKVAEVKRHMRTRRVDVKTAIHEVLKIKL